MSRGEHNLGSDSLGDLLKASLLVEFEAFTRTLGLIERHAVVEVGRGFQVFPRFLLQLLTELLSFYSTNVRYRDADGHRCETPSPPEQEHRSEVRVPFSVGMRCVSSISLPVASTVLPLSSRIRGVGLVTSLASTFLLKTLKLKTSCLSVVPLKFFLLRRYLRGGNSHSV